LLFGQFEDVDEFLGVKAVVVVVGVPQLEVGYPLTPVGAAAVDERFSDFAYFSDVEVGGDAGAVGEFEVQGLRWQRGKSLVGIVSFWLFLIAGYKYSNIAINVQVFRNLYRFRAATVFHCHCFSTPLLCTRAPPPKAF